MDSRGDQALSYIADDEGMDAISFVLRKSIKFVGFSVYQVFSMDQPVEKFTCIYKVKIGSD